MTVSVAGAQAAGRVAPAIGRGDPAVGQRPPSRRRRRVGVLLAAACAWAAGVTAAPLDPPAPDGVAQARELVAAMQANRRGPYDGVYWFCNDGSQLPPEPHACDPHGGGVQHARYSPQRAQLAALGWNVGTILAALDLDAVLAADDRDAVLRELAVERWLVQRQGGWVLRRALTMRGRVQVEDEMRAGRALLERRFATDGWLQEHWLLARELVRSLPHGADDSAMRAVREKARLLAELDPRAEPLRLEVHGALSVEAPAHARELAARLDAGEARAMAVALAQDLEALLGDGGREVRIQEALVRLQAAGVNDLWMAELVDSAQAPPEQRVAVLAAALAGIRELATQPRSGPRGGRIRLQLLDLAAEIDVVLRAALAAAPRADAAPGGADGADGGTDDGRDEAAGQRRLDRLALLVDAATGEGLLSAGERDALRVALEAVRTTAGEGHQAARRELLALLQRVPQWALGSVRHAFAEPLVRYTALEPEAQRFVDDLVRDSVLPALADLTRAWAAADRASGDTAALLFDQEPGGVVALNPGLASGVLRIFASVDAIRPDRIDRDTIVVLPETTADLPPMAGILTLGEGSPLSHLQLLARNFGIPNVAIGRDALAVLKEHADERVTLAVGSDGNIVLHTEAKSLARSATLAAEAAVAAAAAPGAELLEVPQPDLDRTEPIPLAELHAGLSGRQVGPKAANLGELARQFPGRVAPAVALPFGVFAAHLLDGNPSIRQDLEDAYASFALDGDRDALAARLDAVRARIAGLTLGAEARASLVAAMLAEFGPGPDQGVFVRSDTNVEDLARFTGAGLSETVPNVVGLDAQLAAIPRVWSSVLSPRAIAWRSSLLRNPTAVYASVLLMRTVPATKSGVLVTADIVHPGGSGLTVATAWGVGGAVAGEAAETVVLGEDGRVRLVSEAKSPWQRRVDPAGGVRWVPAPAGPVLDAAERARLVELAAEATARLAPVLDDDGQPRPWDIEFGFVDGELTLFQVRPLVERGPQRATRVVRELIAAPLAELDPPPMAPDAAPAPDAASQPDSAPAPDAASQPDSAPGPGGASRPDAVPDAAGTDAAGEPSEAELEAAQGPPAPLDDESDFVPQASRDAVPAPVVDAGDGTGDPSGDEPVPGLPAPAAGPPDAPDVPR